MNKRILTYAIGFGVVLAATSVVHAGYSRAVGNQSQAGVAALKTQAANKKATLQAQQLAEQGKLESLDLSGANTASSDERLLSAPSISDPAIPVIVYADKAAAYQTAIVAALNNAVNQAALVGPAAPAAIAVIVNAAATQVPKDAPTLALYTAIVAQVATPAAAILLNVTVANLTAAATAAKINKLVLEGIVADVAANNAAAPAGSAPDKTAAVCADATSAAAAFGVTYKVNNIDPSTGSWQVTRPLSFTTIKDSAGKDSAGLLHFHQGDFSDTAGFFVGLDETYNYDKLTAQNKEYALSRVDLTPSEWGVVSPMVTPIAPAKVTLNNAKDTVNPIHGKGLTHLLISGDVDAPSVAVVAKDNPKNLYVVTDIYGGSTVLTNDAVMQDAAGNDTIKNVFDIAATRKLTKYFNAGHAADKDRQLLFAAVADNADLKAATAANTGIAVMTVEADKLTPLSAAATNAAGNQAALIDLTDGKLLAKGAAATWAKPVAGVNQGDVNLWWDDRYKQLFGTVAGLKPDATDNTKVAFGLFAGKQDVDTFKLSAMQLLDAGALKTDTEANIAASIFGAAGKDATKDTNAQINLSRPRTMHTSTDKDYLLVTGGVATNNFASSKTWVNALPLQPPDPAGTFKGLACADDGKTALPNAFDKAKTPHVDRILASSAIVDEYTPYIVGRHPSFLAPVAGTANATEVKIGTPKIEVQPGTILAPLSVITSGKDAAQASKLGETTFEIVVGAPGSVVLTNGTKLTKDMKLDKAVTADSALQFSKGTVFKENTKFLADATLTQGGLEVGGADLTLKATSVLAATSLVKKDMELAADATFGAGANTTFGADSKLINGSILEKGSVINAADTADLKVPAGSVVKFDAAAANKISMAAVTDISLVAAHPYGVELHLAQDLAPYTAINSLKLAGALFAKNAVFATPNQAALGLDGALVDSKVALFPLSTADGSPAKAVDGKTCLSNLSKVVTTNFAADPVLGRGLAVANAITQKAVVATTVENTLNAGLKLVIGDAAALPGIPADVYNVLLDVAVASIRPPADNLHVLNAAVGKTANAADEAGKFVKSVMDSAIAQPVGTADEKRALFAKAVTAAYAGTAVGNKTLPSAWAQMVIPYETPTGRFVGVKDEAGFTVDVLKAFEGEIPVDLTASDNLGKKLKAIHKAGNDVADALKERTAVLKAMTATAKAQFPADQLMFDFDAVAQKNDQDNRVAAGAAVQSYCSALGVIPADKATAKGITHAMADPTIVADKALLNNMFATGIKAGLTDLIDVAKYNDSGAKVLEAVATNVLAAAKVNDLPEAAFNALAPLAPAPVGASAGAMAGRSIIKFAPAEDLALVKESMIGANSVLTGVMPQDTWTMNSGLTLATGTYLPAFTLFKKDANVSYQNAQLLMATGSNAAADPGTPWGGQWTLANVQLDRNTTKQDGTPLTLKKAADGIKIVTDRKIASKLAVATPAWEQYSVTVPKDTILPAGTKFEATGALDLSKAFKKVNAGGWDGVSADLDLKAAGDATINEAVKAIDAYDMLDGLTITFPAYPTAMIQDFTLPAGARIKNTSAVALDVHDKIVKAAGGAFLKADGVTNALTLAANESFVLPEEAKIVAGAPHTYFDLAGLTIDNDPLYTAGIISGSVSPVSDIANAYKLPVDMKLKQGYEQTFSPGTTFKKDVAIQPGVVAGADGYVVHADATSFGGTLKAGSMLAVNSAINKSATVDAAKDLVLGKDWQLGNNTVLPEGTKLHFRNAFALDLSNQFKTFDAGTNTWVANADVNFLAAVVANVAGVDKIAPAGGFKIHVANYTIPGDVTVTVPKGTEIAGTIVQKNPAAQSLSADVVVNFANKGTAQIKQYSTLAQASNLATGLTVVNKAKAVGSQPSEVLKTKDGEFKINNAGGKVTLLNDAVGDFTIGAAPVESVTVGANPYTIPGAHLVVGAGLTLDVAPMSKLVVASKFGVDTTLKAPLPLGLDQKVAIGTQIKQGSKIAHNTVVGAGVTLTVIDAHLQLNDIKAVAPVLELHDLTVIDDNTGALRGADSTLAIPAAAGDHGIAVPAGSTWTLANTDKVTLGANTKAKLIDKATIGLGSSFAANSNTVTAQSPFAVSATDMQVVGDTVYIGLEGDRNEANGIEAGVFKSTALFGDGGLVRGWTPWQRVGANTDATAFFGHSESTGNLVYLTSPEGKAFLDTSTDSLINPATTVKLTQWGSGDDVLHDNASLVSALASQFATSDNPQPGVYGLFDFDPDTLSFDTVDRRYFDPVFSMMIATGYERVSLIQTGATDAKTKTFMPTKKFDKTTVFNFGADKGLKGLGTITCAEITRNAPVALGAVAVDNWIFVGGTNGLAVLVDPAGVAFKSGLKAIDKEFPRAKHTFVQLKNGAAPITNVRKIVADQATGYVYVVTKTQVLRIKPGAAAFTGANKGVLAAGDLGNADKNICPLADVANSKYYKQGNGSLLTEKAVDGGNAEFTDLVILKSSTAGTKPATLLLATTAGLVISDDKTIDDAFVGNDGALQTENLWTTFACKYNGTNKTSINARDNAGDAPKKAATVGAALGIMPANIHSGGRLMVTGNDHTFEGNLQVLATNSNGTALRQYRLNASNGKVTPVQEATNKDAVALLPYFAKLGDMDPGTLKNLDDNVFVLAMNSETFASGLPALISAAMVDEAIIAAAVAESELNLGGEYADMLVLPQMMTVSDSASGAVYAPANSGVVVNE